jgi:shikimate O-hydroxycinnamoyltransferase
MQFIDPVHSVEGEPLIKVRLTRTPAGSVLGVSLSHSVADGFSYFYFLTSWSRIFHGKSVYPPSHQRTLLITDSEKKEGHVTGEDVLKESGLFLGPRRPAISRDKLVWETIRLGKQELQTMLAEAQEGSAVRFSFNDVVTAMLWKKFIPQWNQGGEGETTYMSCPVDFRRLLEGFPQNYFGNAVVLATTEITYKQLLSASLTELAQIIRDRVASVGEAYINGTMVVLDHLQKQSGPGINEYIHVAHPGYGMLVTNLSRLPVPEVEFNAGPPVSYEILTPAQRGAVILPSKDGIEIRVCCPVDSD